MNTQFSSEIRGLVLAGGKSSRMGRDKALIEIDNQTQWHRCAQAIMPFCEYVYVSKNKVQDWQIPDPYLEVVDTIENEGPFHAWAKLHTLSAQSAWLIIVCDLLHPSSLAIEQLMPDPSSSDTPCDARCFLSSDGLFPDPQIVFLSPSGAKKAYNAYSKGMKSPRKFLNSIHTQSVLAQDPLWLNSANTPSELNFSNQR